MAENMCWIQADWVVISLPRRLIFSLTVYMVSVLIIAGSS